MFFRLRQSSVTVLLIIILLQLVFSPLLFSINIGQKTESTISEKGSLAPKDEPFFVSQKQAQPHHYPRLAREIKRASESPQEAIQPAVVADLKQSIQKELDVAKQSGAPLFRRLEYENWLKKQVWEIDPSSSFKEKVVTTINSGLVSIGSVFSSKADTAGPAPKETILIPAKPSTFKFSDAEVTIQTLTPPPPSNSPLSKGGELSKNKPLTLADIIKQAKQALVDLWQASPALAQDQTNLPGLADVAADDAEVIIDSQIESLAAELNYNPVAITNYVRSHVAYEPYFGGQKGSSGCLAQLLCNDVDTASLTIALLRSAGIPARYKHSFILVPVEQIKTLLGADQVKTVYVALTIAGLSPKLVNTSIPDGANIDAVNIESETKLALEWTWVEAYVEYDERGGNISFAADKDVISGFVDDAGLRAYLANYPKKQWLGIEPLLNRSMTRIRNTIAADSAGIDAKQFWLDYFQYQGASSPITKFHDDVLGAVGLDSSNPAYSSTVALTPNKNTYDILPPALPYGLVASADNNTGTTIVTVPYSAWPDAWRQTVAVSLALQDGSQTFLNKTFFASEINNQAIYVRYNGATQTDADVIASYGGLASTPAPLVQIVPYLEFAGNVQSGTTPIHIGDTLVLETKLTANGAVIHDSQKFSTAGNEEGMFIAFSTVAADANLDNLNDSGLLAQGTAALARQYLQHLTTGRDTLSGALDYTANFRFMRAIVTQNRSLNVFGDYPTTFDFSGLTMDAATDMNDYSRRDNYKNHRDYFRLLFGLEASRYEGQLFTDVAGLDGISTVSGLQYAYAHPETYTVHTITSANQGEIAGLNISANVKQQITDGVAAGGTAVVPDKNIVKGNFQGILYALLNADGTGEYAIGEQVANGGWTTVGVLLRTYTNQTSQQRDGWLYQFGGKRFYYEDAIIGGVQCGITEAEYNAVVSRPDWLNSFGHPCVISAVIFGMSGFSGSQKQHAYILASNGAYFQSSGQYDYWAYQSDVVSKMKQYINSLPRVDATYNLRFSSLLGTYVQSICTEKGLFNCKNSKYASVYYVPYENGADQGQVYRVKEGFLEKAGEDDNKVIKILGFPISDEQAAAPSIFGTEGVYQNFFNGQMYYYQKYWHRVYYIAGSFSNIYNMNFGGSSGELGFPASDPMPGKNGHVIQVFENSEQFNFDPNFVALGADPGGSITLEQYRKYQCDLNNWYTNDKFVTMTPFGIYIMARGVLDAAKDFISGIWNLGALGVDLVVHLPETIQEIQKLSQVNLYQVLNALVDSGNTAIKDEWDESIDLNGCWSRRYYVAGKAIGLFMTIKMPLEKIKLSSRIKILNKTEDLKYLNRTYDFTDEMAETYAGLAKSVAFKNKPLWGVRSTFANEVAWYSRPLESSAPFNDITRFPGKRFIDAVDIGYLKGNLQYGFYSLNRAIGDSYLMELASHGDEIMYILKQSGEMVIAPRGSYYIPHPILSGGEAVRSAGTIKFISANEIGISNASGHLWPNIESLNDVEKVIKKSFPNMKIVRYNLKGN